MATGPTKPRDASVPQFSRDFIELVWYFLGLSKFLMEPLEKITLRDRRDC
jgi:hypothetical protein